MSAGPAFVPGGGRQTRQSPAERRSVGHAVRQALRVNGPKGGAPVLLLPQGDEGKENIKLKVT